MYGTRDAARLTGLSAARVRSLVRDGFVLPARDARGALVFDVATIARLKRANALVSRIPRGRLRAALAELDGPPDLDHLDVVGGELVVREGPATWEARTGQLAMTFDGDADADADTPTPVQTLSADPDAWTAEQWFDLACDLDGFDDERAAESYRRALGLDDSLVEARVCLARIVAAEDLGAARGLLLEALEADPGHAQGWLELAVVHEAAGDDEDALEAYENALEADAWLAEAHLAASQVCERLDRQADAIRHLAAYKRLIGA